MFEHPQIRLEFHVAPVTNSAGHTAIRHVVVDLKDRGGLYTLAGDRSCLREVDAYLGQLPHLELVVVDAHGYDWDELACQFAWVRDKLRMRCDKAACSSAVATPEQSDPSIWTRSPGPGFLCRPHDLE